MAVQHLMGLAVGCMVYALVVRRYARPRWTGCLAAAPVLFDAYQLQLEHLVMSDVLFMFLVVLAVTLVLWRCETTWRAGVAAGVLLALATLTRPVGGPLIGLFAVFLVVRRVGWRVVAAGLVAAALPVVAYALWFQSATGHFALTNTDGVYLWSRTAAFADCAKIEPPPSLAMMCPSRPPSQREASSSQIWEKGSPVAAHDDVANDRGRRFALKAIAAQPLSYAGVVAEGLGYTFDWSRHPYPKRSITRLYLFPANTRTVPGYPLIQGHESAAYVDYAGTRSTGGIHGPYAGWLRSYQRLVFTRGTMIAALLLVGLAGLIRRERLDLAMILCTVACLLVMPLMTADFDYRYLLPATPFACLAAALTTRRVRPHEREEGPPVETGEPLKSAT